MIESNFDVSFAARLAIREKQIQQNYRPIIAVHKWFARRPGTLFRCLLLAEFASRPLRETFYSWHDFAGLRIADPFMGGGTPILEANRIGCDVVGCDINPMAYWIVQEEIQSLDLRAYGQAAEQLRSRLATQIGHFYKTACGKCGKAADVKYFLWVKRTTCPGCGHPVDLFPGYLLAQDDRHPKNVLVCSSCGELNEVADTANPGACYSCAKRLSLDGPASRGHCTCPLCGEVARYPQPGEGPLSHRLFAIEYYCSACKAGHKGRFFKRPDEDDRTRAEEAETAWQSMQPTFVPDDEIPEGDETTRLHRWGYARYSELFNARQLVGLELSCRLLREQPDIRIRHALATNLSDLLRYQNMLCRYDVKALKSLDVFSVHGFPVGLIACESNLLGIVNGNGTNVGSGGWSNIVEKYAKAKAYCSAPFEIRHDGNRKTVIPIPGEWIGERRIDEFMGTSTAAQRDVMICCQSSTELDLPPETLDGVFTDPPYFGNVQYAELMDFCFVWLRRLIDDAAFRRSSTRHLSELTGNVTLARTLEHFTDGIACVLAKMAVALKPGAPLVFTFHHNQLSAYLPIVVAILDSGLFCTASLPAPAEMAASIHIHGTSSSIIDSVFVLRSEDRTPVNSIASDSDELVQLVQNDVNNLIRGNVKPTRGDIRCIIFGHLVRLAAHNLRQGWRRSADAKTRLQIVETWISNFCDVANIEALVSAGGVGREVPI